MNPAVLRPGSWSALPILILATVLLCMPAAMASPEAPLTSSEIGIRQAHLSWVALARDAEMNAAVTYISVFPETNMSRLNGLYAEFRAKEARIPSITTKEGFDTLVREMRSITDAFRAEIPVQMARGYGKSEDLTIRVRMSTLNNPALEEKKAAYWNIRKANHLADFDAWSLDAQEKLDTLARQGYDTAAAQRTHDVIVSKRPDLVTALNSKNEDQVAAAGRVILPLTRQFVQQVTDLQGTVTVGDVYRSTIDEGYRAVSQADAINNELIAIMLDIGPAEPALKKLKVDLIRADKLLATGNLAATKTQLSLVKTDLKELSGDYRDIVTSADLSPDLAARMKVLIAGLNAMAERMEVS